MYRVLAFLCLATTALAGPRAALLPNGQSLYRNGEPYATATTLGPWSRCEFDDDGATYTAGPMAPMLDGRKWKTPASLPASVVVNGEATPLVRDASVTKALYYRAGQGELQATAYPSALFCRFRYRVKAVDEIQTLSLRFSNIVGRASSFNLQPNGSWDGRIATRLASTEPLHIYVLDAREKFPRGYTIEDGSLDLFVHTNDVPRDTSRDNVRDLRAYSTGNLISTLVPEYVGYLKTDPEIKRAAEEIDADSQASRKNDLYVGLDFWVSLEPVTPTAPLVLLDTYASPIWSPIKYGIGNAELQTAEQRLLSLNKSWLSDSPRGSLLYGDFQHDLKSYFRCRMNNHYFHVTTAWRSFLRTTNPDWYSLARVFSNYYRDACWVDGWVSHGKGLLPSSGPWGLTTHWTDSEALLMAWLVDKDYLALAEYERWAKSVSTYAPPTTNDRESCVFVRMARVAAWYYPTEPRWSTVANAIELRLLAEVARVKTTDGWKKYGVGMPTGMNWHPLWTTKLNLDGRITYEGILSATELADSGQLSQAASLILYGIWPLDGATIRPGPLGENYVNLQIDRCYDFYRGRKIGTEQRLIYATTNANAARVYVEKSDAKASRLRIAISQRIPGDLHPQQVFLTYPNGQRVELTAGARFPQYVNSGQGYVLNPDQQGFVDGWTVAQKEFPYNGPSGRYLVEVTGHALLLHGPLSNYSEWQDCTANVKWPGQDTTGQSPPILYSSPEK